MKNNTKPAEPEDDEKRALWRLCREKCESIQSSKAQRMRQGKPDHPVVLDSDLTPKQLYDEFMKSRTGRCVAMSKDGVLWPMKFLSIDRIDNTQGYNELMDADFIERQAAEAERRGAKLIYVDWIVEYPGTTLPPP